MKAEARLLPGGRLHLRHGPSDLIVWAEGDRAGAYRAAEGRFGTVIAEVVEELDLLRCRLRPGVMPPTGRVARRMHAACAPFASDAFVTSMAAVAGAIADEVLQAMKGAAPLSRAYVNNGGDIALHLAPGRSFRTAIKAHDGRDLGRVSVRAEDGVGGIATSGRHGRSLSCGIADSVTVLARNAALADAAATLVAGAVDLPGHSAILRRPACEVVDDSDLGRRPVVVGCGPLDAAACDRALMRAARRAERYREAALISGASLHLQGRAMIVGAAFTQVEEEAAHA